MTHPDQPKWLTERIDQTSDSSHPGTCPRCGAPVIQARAGRIAALDVIADPTPLSAIDEIHALLEGRLTWHLVAQAFGPPRITWRGITAIRAGPKPGRLVVADHQCPPQPVQETLL